MVVASVACVYDEAGLETQALPGEVLVNGGERQQGRDRGMLRIHAAVCENETRRAVADDLGGVFEQLLQPGNTGCLAALGVEEQAQFDGTPAGLLPGQQNAHAGRVEYGIFQQYLRCDEGAIACEEIAGGAEAGLQ